MSSNDYQHTMTFSLNKRFFKDVNKNTTFSLNSMKSSSTSTTGDSFGILLCSSLPDDIYDCVYKETDTGYIPGTLKDESAVAGWNNIGLETIPELLLYVEWVNDGEAGFTIHVANTSDLQINVGDYNDVVLKGMIIYNTRTNYMLSYARLSSPVQIQNFITIPYDSDLGGVGTCSNTTNNS